MKPEKPKNTHPLGEAIKNKNVIKLIGKRRVRAMTAEDWERLKAYASDPNNKRRYPEIRLDEDVIDGVFGKK